MITEYTNRGVCSRKTIVELDDAGIIKDIKIIGGPDQVANALELALQNIG